MPILKSEGLILRVIPFRDTSKVLTAYTSEHGMVSLLAKGVRGPKPRFGAALELFAHTDLIYYQKDSRELQLLSQASLLEPHLGLTASPERFAYGAAVLEFMLKALTGNEPGGRMFPLALRSLEVLGSCDPGALATVFRAFEIKAISFLGHRPELYRCVECGREPEGSEAWFSAFAGGLVCGDCAPGIDGLMRMDPGVQGTLRGLMHGTLMDLSGSPASSAALNRAGLLLEPFLQAHVERYEMLRALRLAQWLSGRRRRGIATEAES